jgi:AraC-like DNA-binding protein
MARIDFERQPKVVEAHGIRLERLRHGPTLFESEFGGDGTATVIVNLSEAQRVERICHGRSLVRFARWGTATIVAPKVRQRFVVTGVADVIKLVIPLSELEDYGFAGAVPELFNEPHRELERLAYRTALALEENDENFWMAGLCSQLAAIFDPRLRGEESFRGGLSPTARRRLLELIEAHLDLPRATSPSLKAMAAEVDLSVYHFSREFMRTVGMSPYKYTLRRRLERARDHVLQENDDVQTISERYGFASASHFVHRFRQEMGVAPVRLRTLIAGRPVV